MCATMGKTHDDFLSFGGYSLAETVLRSEWQGENIRILL